MIFAHDLIGTVMVKAPDHNHSGTKFLLEIIHCIYFFDGFRHSASIYHLDFHFNHMHQLR